MNKKWVPVILIVVLVAALLGSRQLKNNNEPARGLQVTNDDRLKDPSGNKTGRDNGFDRRTSYLEYSNHAKCRMQCRHISPAEVEDIMRNGEINYKKSDLQSRSQSGAGCPRYAVEGVTGDKQDVRIIFAQCDDKTVVVTVIDLDTEWPCHCPGDDDMPGNSPPKYRN